MRAKTKKWFSPLFVLTLAVAGIFGVSAAVVDKQASDAPVVEKADAASAGETIYFTVPSSKAYDKAPKAFYWSSATGDKYNDMTYVYTTSGNNPEKVYKYKFPSGVDGYKFQYFRNTDQNWGMISEWRTDFSTANGKRCYDNSGAGFNDNFALGFTNLTTFSVAFNSNGGTGTMTNQTGCYCNASAGTANTLKTNTFTREGYTFTGWNTQQGGGGTSFTNGGIVDKSSSGTLTLYAQWRRNAGYYVIGKGVNGSSESWSIDEATASSGSDTTYEAKFLNVSLSATSEYKVIYYNASGVMTYYNNLDSTRRANTTVSDNIKTTTEGSYNIYFDANASNKIYVDWIVSFECWKKIGDNAAVKVGDFYGDTNTIISTSLSGQSVYGTETGYSITGYYVDKTCSSSLNVNNKPTTNLLICAQYTINKYDIVYKRNNGSATSDVTEQKTHDQSYNFATPGYGSLTGSGWNPTNFKYFKHWNTSSEDDGATYNAGASYTDNSAKTLFYIEDWWDYRYKCGSESWINLVHNDAGKGGDIMVQFAPTSAHILTVNQFLSFQVNKHDGAGGADNWVDLPYTVDYSDDRNNYNTTTGILLTTTDTIYLKITNEGTYKCWVPGISDRTITVHTTVESFKPYTLKGNGDTECVTPSAIIVKRGEFIRAQYLGNTPYSFGTLDGASDPAFELSDGDVRCTVTGAYTIYLQKNGNDWNKVYIAKDYLATAQYLAQTFNTNISTICTGIIGGTKSLSDLKTAWGTTSASGMYYHFYNQPSGVTSYFTTSSGDSDADILACKTRYDYVLNKYGTSQLPNFMGRTGPYKPAINTFSPFTLMGGEDGVDTSVILIIVASSISILSITALSVLMVKKKKSANK